MKKSFGAKTPLFHAPVLLVGSYYQAGMSVRLLAEISWPAP